MMLYHGTAGKHNILQRGLLPRKETNTRTPPAIPRKSCEESIYLTDDFATAAYYALLRSKDLGTTTGEIFYVDARNLLVDDAHAGEETIISNEDNFIIEDAEDSLSSYRTARTNTKPKVITQCTIHSSARTDPYMKRFEEACFDRNRLELTEEQQKECDQLSQKLENKYCHENG